MASVLSGQGRPPSDLATAKNKTHFSKKKEKISLTKQPSSCSIFCNFFQYTFSNYQNTFWWNCTWMRETAAIRIMIPVSTKSIVIHMQGDFLHQHSYQMKFCCSKSCRAQSSIKLILITIAATATFFWRK